MRLALVGVAGRALIGLSAIRALVEALVTTGNSNPVVTRQIPGLLEESRVGSPNLHTKNCSEPHPLRVVTKCGSYLESSVVGWGRASIESEVRAMEEDGAGARIDVPVQSPGAAAVRGGNLRTHTRLGGRSETFAGLGDNLHARVALVERRGGGGGKTEEGEEGGEDGELHRCLGEMIFWISDLSLKRVGSTPGVYIVFHAASFE